MALFTPEELARDRATRPQPSWKMRYLGDPILTAPTKRLVDASDIPYGLLDAMRRFNGTAWAEGLGFSANQAGASLRLSIAMLFDDKMKPTRKNPTPRKEVLLINPRIVDASDVTLTMVEGCLSIPNFRNNVKRHTWVTIEYFDMAFTRQTLRLEGLDAQIVQHEIEHLDGRTILEGASRNVRRQAERHTAKFAGARR